MSFRIQNNFGALRLYLAATVFLCHIFELSRHEQLWLFSLLDTGFAVQGFFVISGYLIAGSAMRSRSLTDYWRNRALRILPAYWAALVLGVIVAVYCSNAGLAKLWSEETAKYFAANLLFLGFLAPNIPPAFADNTFQAINGALWTIKIEVGFYLLAPFLIRIFAAKRPVIWLAAVYLASVGYTLILEYLHFATGRDLFLFLARQLPGQLCFFVAGMAWHQVREFNLPRLTQVFFISAGLFVLARFVPVVSTWLTPVAISGLMISLAYWPSRASRLDDFGDLSYGIYVYHFPILQALIAVGVFRMGDTGLWGVVIGILLVAAFAAMSWFWLERPALGAKRASLSRRGPSPEKAIAGPLH